MLHINIIIAEFVWSPSNHHLVQSSKYHMFKKSVMELFMIRHVSDGATMMVWLPNELMFEICRSLFLLYFLDTETISSSDSSDDDDSDDDRSEQYSDDDIDYDYDDYDD